MTFTRFLVNILGAGRGFVQTRTATCVPKIKLVLVMSFTSGLVLVHTGFLQRAVKHEVIQTDR